MFLYFSNKIAINYGESQIGYDELHNRISNASKLYDINQDDRVAIFSENRPGWIYSFYSVWLNKGSVVPIDFMLPVEDVAYILKDSQPKVIFVSEKTKQIANQALKLCKAEAKIIYIESLESDVTLYDVQLEINPDIKERAVIVYTSGTTGSPKGVMLSFENILVNLKSVVEEIPILTFSQNIMILLPLHHILPLVGTLIAPFYSGGSVSISPTMASADIIKTMNDCGVSILIGVPRLYEAIHKGIMDKIDAGKVTKMVFRIAKTIKNKRFSKFIFGKVHRKMGGRLHTLVCGGAAVDPRIVSDFMTLGFEFLEGYGMTELAPMITFTRPGKVRLGSPGQVVPFAEVKSFDGELVVKGPNVMMGYYNNPEETQAIIKDGWLYTGDLGYVGDDGYVFITGRKKELIILSNGKNIQPAEIENRLMAVSGLMSEVAVFQRKDHLHAILLLSDQGLGIVDKNIGEILRKEVFDIYNKSVPSYKRVIHFTIATDELPKTRLGKIKRHTLENIVNEIEKNRKAPETLNNDVQKFDELNILITYLMNERKNMVSPSHHIEYDLGLDSLDKVSLQSFIDATFGVNLEPDQLTNFANIEELCLFIKENRSRMKVEKVDWKKIIRERVHIQFPHTWITAPLITKFSKYFFQLYFRFKSTGHENIPDGPCIIAPNHQSYFDGLFVTSFLKRKQINKTYFYAKEKHVKGRLLKFFAHRNNIIVMDLNKDLKMSIQKMAEVLRNQKYLVIFPEGTRTNNGLLGDFKKTFAILSSELSIPIVPVSIKGAFEALPKGSIFPYPFRKINIQYLQPVYPGSHSYENIAKQVRSRIMEHQVS